MVLFIFWLYYCRATNNISKLYFPLPLRALRKYENNYRFPINIVKVFLFALIIFTLFTRTLLKHIAAISACTRSVLNGTYCLTTHIKCIQRVGEPVSIIFIKIKSPFVSPMFVIHSE